MSLTPRILAVNIFALALLVGGFVYLGAFRTRLIDQQVLQARREAILIAIAIENSDPADIPRMVRSFAQRNGQRIRIYGPSGRLIADSFKLAPPTYSFVDPEKEPWRKDAARWLDRTIDAAIGAPHIPYYREPRRDGLQAWPEALVAEGTNRAIGLWRYAPDRTPVVSAAAPIPQRDAVLLTTANTRHVITEVRAERFRLGLVLAIVATLSVLLSLFLARTIVRPLRRLARAAVRVRTGRAREVVVPRLPSRRDEIGMLARALSDMSQALSQRMDAIEGFAADVTHEIKNPLASLRSAVEALHSVKDPALQEQLLKVADDDIRRLDRLVTDISEASRMDARLMRSHFERVDLGMLVDDLVRAHEARPNERGVQIVYARPRRGTTVVMGDANALVRVVENLLDNAISFSPADGLVRLTCTCFDNQVLVRVEDEGPGVPAEQRDAIFRRFHSFRPEARFGCHSGLGLAIAKTIIEAHNGTIRVADREEGATGAQFDVILPVAPASLDGQS